MTKQVGITYCPQFHVEAADRKIDGFTLFADGDAVADFAFDLGDFASECANNLNAFPELLEAVKFAKEIIDDQAARFHQDCRCRLCESLPMMIDAAISKAEGK